MKSIKKRLIRGSGVYTIGKILPKLISFLLIPVYTRFLTTSDYGIVAVANVISQIIMLFMWVGLPASVTRFYFEYEKDSEEYRNFLGTVFIFFIFSSSSLVLLLTLFGKSMFNSFFANVPFSPFIILVLWLSMFRAYGDIILGLYRAREQAKLYVIVRVSEFIVITGFIIYFVTFLRQGALGKIRGEFFGSLIFFCIFIFISIRESNIRFSLSKLKKALTFGLPLVPHALSVIILSSADRILLERLSTLSQVGLYNIGYHIGGAFLLITSSIDYAWQPIYYSVAQEEEESDARRIFSRMTTIYMTIGFVLASGLILFSKEIVYFMAAENFHTAWRVVPIISAGYFIQCFHLMNVKAFFLTKKTYYIAPLTAIVAALNIILNILWIPEYGMIGAAYATLISLTVRGILTNIFAQRIYNIPYEYRRIFILCILLGCVFYINYSLNIESLPILLITKLLIFLGFLSLLLLFRIISPENLSSIKKLFKSGE